MAAKQQLEGKDMFQGCCTLNITYSSTQPPLRIVANNERARDFSVTAAAAPAPAPYMAPYDPYGGQYGAPAYPPATSGYPGVPDPYAGSSGPPPSQHGPRSDSGAPFRGGGYGGGGGGVVVLVNGLVPEQVGCV